MPKLRKKGVEAEELDPVDSVPPPKRQALIDVPKGWQRASDALERIKAVSTIFPDLNRATRCGGLPVCRMHTIHGPTHGGKSGLILGLIKSFLLGGHIAAYIDAEHSTPWEFVEELLGDLVRDPNFFAQKPATYEEAINAVDELLEMVTKARKTRPELCCIIAVDSINKLSPEREIKNILKAGGDEVAKGHAGRYRAAINQSWLNHLSPLLSNAACAMVFIAQERDDGNGEVWEADGGVEIKGGQALSFDASLLMRVTKRAAVRLPGKDGDKKGPVVGFQHGVRIYKSKVSHMDGAYTDAVYYFSNGKHTPAGFDTPHDAIHVAKELGIIDVRSSWLSWRKNRWQGEPKAALWLSKNPNALHQMLSDIDAKLRLKK